MNIKSVGYNYVRMSSKVDNQKLMIQLTDDSNLVELLKAFKTLLNASGYDYVAEVTARSEVAFHTSESEHDDASQLDEAYASSEDQIDRNYPSIEDQMRESKQLPF